MAANLADLPAGINREHHTRKLAAGRGDSAAVPLFCRKFPCLADLIPLFRGAAELIRKRLI
jgi:hypothetical protein